MNGMEEPLISIIIVNWNRKELLKKCLQSVIAQTYTNKEIVVVDNASTDGSADFVKIQFPTIKIIASKENLGFAKGNNVGIQTAQGDYVALINNDATLDAKWLAELVKSTKDSPDAAMFGSKVLYAHNKKFINSTGNLIYGDLTIANRGIGKEDKGQYNIKDEVFGPYGAAALYKKSVIENVGLFDEDYFMYGEENDLNWRVRLAGWICMYVPTAICYHLRDSPTGIGFVNKLYYTERNRIWTLIKNLPLDFIFFSIFYSIRRYYVSWRNAKKARRYGNQVTMPPHVSVSKLALIFLKAWFHGIGSFHKLINKRRNIGRIKRLTKSDVRKIFGRYKATLSEVFGSYVIPQKVENIM